MAMKYVAAYLLKAISNDGEGTPSEADVREILEAGGISIDDEMLKAFMKKIESMTMEQITESIATGREKLESFGGGGGVAAAPAAGAAGGDGAAAAAAEEVVEEEEEEEMDFDLFG